VKPNLLEFYKPILQKFVPLNICEIGTHNATSAIQFIDIIIPLVPAKHKLHYTGYDLFDDADDKLTEYEHNGKGPGSYKRAKHNLNHRITKYKKKFSYTLVRGNTFETLTEQEFDFVYIDGGHSYKTVMHDYDKVKNSKIIVFDDYQLPEVKRAVDEIIQNLGTRYEIMENNPIEIPKRKQLMINSWTNKKHDQVCLIKGNYS